MEKVKATKRICYLFKMIADNRPLTPFEHLLKKLAIVNPSSIFFEKHVYPYNPDGLSHAPEDLEVQCQGGWGLCPLSLFGRVET